MSRGESPLDAGDGVLLSLAADLRRLRDKAGGPTYRVLSARAHYSVATLSAAAAGHKLPSLAVTLAYVRACGGDPAQWERRWHAVAAELRVSRVAWNFGDDPCELYAAVPTVSGRWAASGWVCRCSAVTS